MSSRDQILATIAKNKPKPAPLPEDKAPMAAAAEGLSEIFSEVAVSIGSKVFPVKDYSEAEKILALEFPEAGRVVSAINEFKVPSATVVQAAENPHSLENTDLAILPGLLAVAENSAIWITEKQMSHRVLPFICQHLVLVIREADIVRNMHEAYQKTRSMEAGYGVFIAGPSKTADIEQSLVLGAHGPRSLRIFILSGERESDDKKQMQ